MKYLITACLLISSSFAWADDSARLQKELSKIKNFSAEFTQKIASARFGDELASGEVVIEKPNKMRWVYTQPEGRIFLADGTHFYRYDKLDGVEHKSDQKELMEQPTSFFFLWENVDLKKHFSISEKKQSAKFSTYTLTPKDLQSDMKKIEINVSFSPFQISSIQTTDQLNQKNTLEFKKVGINTKLSKSTFDYTIAKKSLGKKS